MDLIDLHDGKRPWVLPNAWDVSSALALMRAGFEAIGTTSLGVAAAHGLVDGSGDTMRGTIDLVSTLRGLPVLLNVDLEDGFSAVPEEVAELVASLNVAGVNLEDSTRGRLVGSTDHAAKVAAIKEAAPHVFVNARVDTFWLDQDATLEETITRAQTYVDAGADGVFVPGGDLDSATMTAVCASIAAPVNVLASPRYTRSQLGEMGVARISTGSLLYRSALQRSADVALAIAADEAAPVGQPTYAEVQQWTARQ